MKRTCILILWFGFMLQQGACVDDSALGRVELRLAVDDAQCEDFCVENLHVALYFVDDTGIPAFQTLPCTGGTVVFDSIMAGAQVYAVVQGHRWDGMSLMGQSDSVTVPAFASAELSVSMEAVAAFIPEVTEVSSGDEDMLTVIGSGFGDPSEGLTRLEIDGVEQKTEMWTDGKIQFSSPGGDTSFSLVVRTCGVPSAAYIFGEDQ